MNRTRWLAGVALAAVLIVLLAVGRELVRSEGDGDRGSEDDSPLVELARLRDAVAACNAQIAEEQAHFRAHDERVDSLRTVVLGHESEDRTVPAPQFDAYLEAFNAYNESVTGWHDRAASLRASWDSCRVLIERHNDLVDSLSVEPLSTEVSYAHPALSVRRLGRDHRAPRRSR